MRWIHFSPRRVVASFGGLVLLVGMLALAACGSAGTASGNTSGTSASNTSAQSILNKVEHNDLKTTHLSTAVNLNTSGSSGTSATSITTKSTGDVVLKPTFAAQLSTDVQNGSQTSSSQQIIANNTVYVKQGTNNSWQTITLPSNTLSTLPIVSLRNLDSLHNLRYVGTTQFNGETVDQLEGTGTQMIGSSALSYNEMILVNKSGYPQKITLTSSTPAGDVNAVTTFSQWNQPVTITVPNGGSTITAG